jgi:hypothetical protein
MQARGDNGGANLLGGQNYTMTWSADDIPKVDAYWSLTMYDDKGVYIPDVSRNSISSNTDLIYEEDGSLILHFQPTNPGSSVNWFPSPSNGLFQLFLRVYLPKEEIASGTYGPPLPVKNVQLE